MPKNYLTGCYIAISVATIVPVFIGVHWKSAVPEILNKLVAVSLRLPFSKRATT
jgi:hypothetical protein